MTKTWVYPKDHETCYYTSSTIWYAFWIVRFALLFPPSDIWYIAQNVYGIALKTREQRGFWFWLVWYFSYLISNKWNYYDCIIVIIIIIGYIKDIKRYSNFSADISVLNIEPLLNRMVPTKSYHVQYRSDPT